MKKPEGYDSTEAKFDNGSFERPPLGGHIFAIKGAQETVSKAGNQMLVLELDISTGAFAGYFRDKSTRVGKNCFLRYYQLTSGNSLPFYKGVITSIEKSNSGFKFDHNEANLLGKTVGGKLDLDEKGYQKVTMLCSAERALTINQEPCPAAVKKTEPSGQASMFDSSSNINPPDPNREQVPW